MDEKKLGEAIGEAVGKANAAVMPDVTKMLGEFQARLQTGVVTEVESEELAGLLRARGKTLRQRAEEAATQKPEILTVQTFLESMPAYVRCDYTKEGGGPEVEALVRARNENIEKNHRAIVKSVTHRLRTEAERLDFMAAHLMKRSYRLDARELDDLLFADRHACSSTAMGVTY